MRHTHGSIEVVCGSMFSGKTDELIRRLVRATIAKQKVQVFKPAIDIRYAVEKVTSHAGSNYDAMPVENAADIRNKLDDDTTVVGIDEAQFFDSEIVQIADAICMVCGDEASRTQRLVNGRPARYDDPVVIVGASELYEARCRLHHEVPR